jgi:hypothetical protein
MVTKAELGVNVRKLDSNLRTAMITPCSTCGKYRNGKVEQSMDSPSSPRISSPMSSHAILHLRDLEFEDDKEEEEGTAKQ